MTSILTLLQIALALLSNPQVQSNPAALAQAQSFATEAIQIAAESLQNPTSSPSVATTTPIVIPSVPVVQATTTYTAPVVQSVPQTQNVGVSSPTSSAPTQISWYKMVVQGGVQCLNCSLKNEQVENWPTIAPGKVVFEWDINPLYRSDSMSGTLTINGQTMPFGVAPGDPSHELTLIVSSSSGITSGSYPFTIQFNSGNYSATYSDSVSLP